MRGTLLCLLSVLVLLPVATGNVVITELMPHPAEDEFLNEWVEIHNNASSDVNLSGWVIGDSADNDTLLSGSSDGSDFILPPFGYAIIADSETRVHSNFDMPSSTRRLYVDDDSIGNGLSNIGESFALYNNHHERDRFTYPSSQEGMSVSLLSASIGHSFPTPGKANDDSFTENCDYKIELLMNTTSFGSPDEVGWQFRAVNEWGDPTTIEGDAVLEDFFGNTIQTYSVWTNQSITSQRTSSEYTPNLEGGRSYRLAANLSTQCPEASSQNNELTEVFSVEDTLPHASNMTILNILDLGSDGEAEFGQTIRLRLWIYKGNTTKESVAAWLEHGSDRISKTSRVSILEQFSEVEVTMPIHIRPDCEESFDPRVYTLHVAGLGTKTQGTLKVEDHDEDACETVIEEPSGFDETLDLELAELPAYHDGKASAATLRIINGRESEETVEIWSYIYRGSASYSGHRERNKRTLTFQPKSDNLVTIANMPAIEEEGEYRIKFLAQPSYRKTPETITKDIVITKPADEQQTLQTIAASPDDAIASQKRAATARAISPPVVLYESSSHKARGLAPFLLVAILIFVVIFLLLRA